MNLDGVAALVTGAASGLGAASAAALAARSVEVVGVDLADAFDRVEPVAGVRRVPGDVTSEHDVQAALDTIAAPLRLVVNCAGIAPASRIVSSRGPHNLALFRRTIEVNLIGTFNVLRLAASVMAAGEPDQSGQRGLIVNTASIAAYEGQIGQAAYAASKGGVVALTITAARDLARHGIRVLTIAPGVVDTAMLRSLDDRARDALAAEVPFPQRLGTAGDYAQLVLMLAEHDYLNGETIRMDGALRMPSR